MSRLSMQKGRNSNLLRRVSCKAADLMATEAYVIWYVEGARKSRTKQIAPYRRISLRRSLVLENQAHHNKS